MVLSWTLARFFLMVISEALARYLMLILSSRMARFFFMIFIWSIGSLLSRDSFIHYGSLSYGGALSKIDSRSLIVALS